MGRSWRSGPQRRRQHRPTLRSGRCTRRAGRDRRRTRLPGHAQPGARPRSGAHPGPPGLQFRPDRGGAPGRSGRRGSLSQDPGRARGHGSAVGPGGGGRGRGGPRRTGHRARRRAGGASLVSARSVARPGGLADRAARQPGGPGRLAGLGRVALGGDYARLRTDSALAGPGADSRLLALYFSADHQMHDFRTIQHHRRPRPDRTCCTRARSPTRPAPCTAVSSGLKRERRHQRHADQPQPGAARGGRTPNRCPTLRSRTTTYAAATPPQWGRSLTISASTWRAAASRPTPPSG